MTREEMISKYEEKSAATSHIFGFPFEGALYSYTTNDLSEIDEVLKLGRAAKSHGGAQKIRISFSKLTKKKLIDNGKAVKLGTLDIMSYIDKYNAGEHFEHYIHELNGQTWVKDTVPFYKAGDIELDGEQVQIKYDGATLVSEATLVRLYA